MINYQWTDNDTPGIYWCSYCGKDIWLPPEQAKTPEQFICYECKRVLDTYDGTVRSPDLEM